MPSPDSISLSSWAAGQADYWKGCPTAKAVQIRQKCDQTLGLVGLVGVVRFFAIINISYAILCGWPLAYSYIHACICVFECVCSESKLHLKFYTYLSGYKRGYMGMRHVCETAFINRFTFSKGGNSCMII